MKYIWLSSDKLWQLLIENVCVWQFKAAIANVWVLRSQEVTEVSLFSTQIIPDFMSRQKASDGEEFVEGSSLPDVEPLLYIG